MYFESASNRVSPAQKRVDSIAQAVQELLVSSSVTPRRIQRIIGMAVSMRDVVHLTGLNIRPVQWIMSELFSFPIQDWDQTTPTPEILKEALRPWTDREWLSKGVPLRRMEQVRSICTDASMSGWGAHLLPEFETVSGAWDYSRSLPHINVLELEAVRLALLHWKDRLRGCTVQILSDNATVCSYIRRQGGTHSRTLCELTITLWKTADPLGIFLEARHIPGKLNVIADGLSRREPLPSEWILQEEIFQRIRACYPSMTVDAFATRFNTKLPAFFSPFPDPEALAIDALTANWDGLDLYAFPPTVLIPAILRKLQDHQCLMTLIAPFRWDRSWVSLLFHRSLEPPRRLRLKEDSLFQLPDRVHPDPGMLNLHVWRLFGGLSGREASPSGHRRGSWRTAGPPL